MAYIFAEPKKAMELFVQRMFQERINPAVDRYGGCCVCGGGEGGAAAHVWGAHQSGGGPVEHIKYGLGGEGCGVRSACQGSEH